MRTSSQRPRRLLFQWLVMLAVLLASDVARAGLLDLFFGEGPLLKQRVQMGPDGLALFGSFRVATKCGYEFDLRLLHKQEKFGELDALFDGGAFPVPVTLRVFPEGDRGAGAVVQFEQAPRISSRAAVMTIFNLARASLDKGRYRVELKSAAVPKLAGVDVDFVVQLRPKTSCS